jgi:hypothetical protein
VLAFSKTLLLFSLIFMFGFGFKSNRMLFRIRSDFFQNSFPRNAHYRKKNSVHNILLFMLHIILFVCKIIFKIINFFWKLFLFLIIISFKFFFSLAAQILFFTIKYLVSKIYSRFSSTKIQKIKKRRIFIKVLAIFLLIHFFF